MENGRFQTIDFGSWKSRACLSTDNLSNIQNHKVDRAQKFEIELSNWTGTVAAINVNGKEVGIIQVQPYVLQVELAPGENIIDVVVIGS